MSEQPSPQEDAVWLRRGLQEILDQMAQAGAPDDAKVPELFSGNCRSPLWFVGENPAGRGERPSFGEVRQNCRSYIDFYVNRFGNLPYDLTGEPLSKVNLNYVFYMQTFCYAAGISRQQIGAMLMKTNAFGVHAGSDQVLRSIFNPYPLVEWVRNLIEVCKPAYVVGIGRVADGLIQALQRDIRSDGAIEFFSFRPCPNWRRSRECTELMRRLGSEWAARRTGDGQSNAPQQ